MNNRLPSRKPNQDTWIPVVAMMTGTLLLTTSVAAKASPNTPRTAHSNATARLIVQTREDSPMSRRSVRLALQGKVTHLGRTLTGMDCAIVEATPAQAKRLAADPRILSVTPDRAVRGESLPDLDLNRAALGADQVNGSLGYSGSITGSGVGVAVLDSGIDGSHPDLLLRVIGFKDFVNGQNYYAYDDYGHGTHVAGLIGGSGLMGLLTGTSANYRGVAPAVNLVGVKVLNAQGAGRVSDVIAGLDWCVTNKARYGLRVVNLSLSAAVTSSYTSDPLCLAAERAVRAGLVVVTSAGNWGGIYGTVGAPGNDPMVITVGASNTRGTIGRNDDVITTYTGRGPTRYDILVKPDLIAPGNDIVSLRAPGSSIDTMYPGQTRLATTPFYARLSGTSMSAALVSGAAALLVNANRNLTPVGVKAALLFTAQTLSGYDPVTHITGPYDPMAQGAGELNLVGAISMAQQMRKTVGFTGTPSLSSFIGGQTVTWAGATIPSLLSRPGYVWGDTLLWGGNTGRTIDQARVVWGSNVVWGGNGQDPPPPRIWNDDLVYGTNVVWGGNGQDPPPPGIVAPEFVWANNVVWGGNGQDPPPPLTTPFVIANNVVWGGNGQDPPPPRIVDPVNPALTVGGDNQQWGGIGEGIIYPDPITGP